MWSVITNGIIQNAKALFSLRLLMWHAFAILLTALLVLSGFDWWFYVATRYEALNPLIWFAGISFYVFIVLVPLSIYLAGEWRGDESLKRKAGILMQAIILGALLSGLYKVLTGRIEPPFMYIGTEDISRAFQFGFFNHGVFWGWPSSHATVVVAGAITLVHLFRSPTVSVIAVLYAISVAVGAGVGFHWFSDVLAGVIFGSLVGYVVSKGAFAKIEQ